MRKALLAVAVALSLMLITDAGAEDDLTGIKCAVAPGPHTVTIALSLNVPFGGNKLLSLRCTLITYPGAIAGDDYSCVTFYTVDTAPGPSGWAGQRIFQIRDGFGVLTGVFLLDEYACPTHVAYQLSPTSWTPYTPVR